MLESNYVMSNPAQTNANGPTRRPFQGPVLDPRAPNLAQPFKRLVEEGFVTELTVKFTPTGTTVSGKPDKRLASVPDSGLTAGVDAPVGMMSAAADKGNLIPRGGKTKTSGKAEQPRPKKSLVKADCELPPAELLARARAVADASGGNTLVGRVRSADNFDGKVTTSFQDWWASATHEKRASCLVLGRYRSEMGPECIRKIGALPCPFRGTATFAVNEEEEDAASKKG